MSEGGGRDGERKEREIDTAGSHFVHGHVKHYFLLYIFSQVIYIHVRLYSVLSTYMYIHITYITYMY